MPPALLGVIGVVGFAGLLEIVPRLGLVQIHYLPPTSGRSTMRHALLSCPAVLGTQE